MQALSIIILGTAVLSFLVLRFVQSFRAKNGPRRIPGPTLFPLIGRIHDLPVENVWLKFYEWAQLYGQKTGFFYTEMLGDKFVVICDETVAEDLLVKRGKHNSDRPEIKSLFDSKSNTGTMEYLPLMGRNKYWSRQRKLTHAYLTQAAGAHWHGIMDHEVKRWLVRLIESPDSFQETLDDMASKIMCHLTWDDPSLSQKLSRTSYALLTQMSPAGRITNVLTPLWDWFSESINPFKWTERKRHDEQLEWWMELYSAAQKKVADGTMRPCWTRQYIEMGTRGSLSGDREAANALGMLATVGISTVEGPINFFLMAMVEHPEWQRKAQQEIDDQCGGNLPTLKDFSKLPVLRACIRETMRWLPSVPTGVAHEAEVDDFYQGYHIPKGTRILPLDWAFLRNEAKYPDAWNYRPERWLNAGWPTYQEPLTRYPMLNGFSSFGWGQRKCLGQSLTQDELLITCGAVLWCFNLKHRMDPVTGQAVPIAHRKSNSFLILRPNAFQMTFEPRSEKRKLAAQELWTLSDAEDREKRLQFLREVEGSR